jgi:phosphatidylserine/phosphatidylglycerophosphate/cardiolipin synthase-like enzyme
MLTTRSILLMAVAAIGFPATSVANPSADQELEQLIAGLGRAPVTSNQRVELLWDPSTALERRIELLSGAEHHILLSVLQWYDDPSGRRFLDHFTEVVRTRRAADPGFAALVLFDGTTAAFGTPLARIARELREAGAEVRQFNAPFFAGATPVFEARLHDKMLVVDGRRVILGGRNLADRYLDPFDSWRDCDVLVEGPAAQEAQMHFLKAWATARYLKQAQRLLAPHETTIAQIRSLWRSGRWCNGTTPLEPYLNDAFFPPVEAGDLPHRVAVLYDNSLVWPTAPTAHLLAELLDRAQHSVDVMTPFPNLTRELTDAVLRATGRGVRVRLLVNDEHAMVRDSVFWIAILPTLIELVEGGVEVWAWQGNRDLLSESARQECVPERLPGRSVHAKLVRIDDRVGIVHSSNFNYRSTHYNTEAGVLVLDPGFVHTLEGLFDELIADRDRSFACTSETGTVPIEVHTLTRINESRLPDLRRQLGRLQGFVDSMSLMW